LHTTTVSFCDTSWFFNMSWGRSAIDEMRVVHTLALPILMDCLLIFVPCSTMVHDPMFNGTFSLFVGSGSFYERGINKGNKSFCSKETDPTHLLSRGDEADDLIRYLVESCRNLPPSMMRTIALSATFLAFIIRYDENHSSTRSTWSGISLLNFSKTIVTVD
jgi:hypothetical protein